MHWLLQRIITALPRMALRHALPPPLHQCHLLFLPFPSLLVLYLSGMDCDAHVYRSSRILFYRFSIFIV